MKDILVAKDGLKVKGKKVEIIFLGTNGWYDTYTGNTVCTLIKHREFNIIIDAGFGIYKLDKYADLSKTSYLFISHFHLDHICGFHVLARLKFKKLNIFVRKNGKKILNRIISDEYTVPFSKLPYKVNLFELGKKEYKLPFKVEFKELVHSVKTLGFRFEIDDEVITVISDTGYCKNAVELACKSDLLITECSYLPGEKNNKWPHLSPELAFKIKKESKSKKLILTHFAADKYVTLKQRKKLYLKNKNL